MLILVALVCVPWMWFAKPYYLKLQHEKHKYGAIALPDDDAPTAAVAATEAATRAAAASDSTASTEVVQEDDDDGEEEEEVSQYIHYSF